MSMDTPSTPKRSRPTIGHRSFTDTPRSPPKARPDHPALPPKKHHLDLFNHSQHRHHHPFHTSHSRDSKSNSKANLRQHLQHPVNELANIVGAGGEVSGKASELNSRERLGQAPAISLPSRPIRPEDVEYERRKGRLRDEEVRNALNKLSDTAQSNTRRLDAAYYSLLEKARMLRSTIASLQELSTASSERREGFQRDAGNVARDTQAQIDAINGFNDQQERVQELESRVKASMAKTEELSARLEAARKRVDHWDAREREWQAKTSKRLTIGWSCLGVLIILITILLVVRRLTASPPIMEITNAEQLKNGSLPSFIVEELAEISSRRLEARNTSPAAPSVTLPNERRLKGFEEL